MRIQTIIKGLLNMHGINQENFAKMLGLAGSSGVRGRLNRDGMTVDNMLNMLDLLGYEVVVRELRTGRKREDEIILTREDDEF